MKEKPDDATKEKWLNDSANWKAGFIYYNPNDKRIFPPKKYGMGWTVNFANPFSVLAFALVIIIAIITTYLFNR
ncbi:MAG: DUF5808 domain-containing protein [Bacteroidetes bacterium]|jgi:uncharacterized membrane protein|nr:DUF5808 domain-containing protein [Bacteroidota bacterium]